MLRVFRAQRGGQDHDHQVNLFRKELRLHQLSFALAGLFGLAWLCTLLVNLWKPDLGETLLGFVLGLFVVMLMTTVGAVSIAEEWPLGLVGWHRTLPVASAKQWLVKLAVTLGLAALLGLVLPWLMGFATWGSEPLYQKLGADPTGRWVMVGSILLLAGLGFCAALLLGGMEGLVLCVPAMSSRLAVEQQQLQERNRPGKALPQPQDRSPRLR